MSTVLRRLLATFLLVLSLAALGAWLHTPHGFAHALLPLANAALDGELRAARGRASLSGAFRLEDVRYSDASGTEVFRAASVIGRARPRSLAGWLTGATRPELEALEVDRAELRIRLPAETDAAPAAATPAPRDALLPVSLLSGLASQSALTLLQGAEPVLRASDLDVRVERVAPGQSGRVEGHARVLLGPGEGGDPPLLELRAALDLEQSADATRLAWTGGVEASVADLRASESVEDARQLRVALETRGQTDRWRSLDASLELRARLDAEDAGRLTARVEWTAATGEVDAAADAEQVGADLMNLLLHARGGPLLASGALQGSVAAKGDAGQLALELALQATRLSARTSAERPGSPPLDVRADASGRWSRANGRLGLERLRVELARGDRALASIELQERATLPLDLGATSADAPATLRATLAAATLADLRPWADLIGLDVPQVLEAGRIDAALALDVDLLDVGRHIDARGRVELSGARLRRAGELALGPLGVRAELDGSLARLSALDVRSSELSLSLDGRELARGGVQGVASFEDGELRLGIEVRSADLSAALGRLGTLDGLTALRLEGGEFGARATLARTRAGEPLALGGEGRWNGVALVSGERRLRRSLSGSWSAELAPDASRVRLRDVSLELVAPGDPIAATLRARGEWALDRGAHSIELRVRDLDPVPWLELRGRSIRLPLAGRARLAADWTLSRPPSGDGLALRGEERLAAQLAAGDAPPQAVTLTSVSRIDGLATPAPTFALELFAEREDGGRDALRLEGSVDLAARPRVRGEVHVRSLDAAFWHAATRRRPPGEAREAWLRALPFDLAASVHVDQLSYADVRVAAADARVRRDGDDVEVVVRELKLGTGSLAGQLTSRREDGRTLWGWSARGQGLELAPLFRAAYPESERRMDGVLAFCTRAALAAGAQGSRFVDAGGRIAAPACPEGTTAGAAESDTAAGFLSFDIGQADARTWNLFRWGILDRVAAVTRTATFQTARLDRSRAQLALDGDVARVTQMWVRGPVVELRVDGTLGLDGQVDVSIKPAIGSSLAADNEFFRLLARTPPLRWVPLSRLAPATEGYVGFPVALKLRGPIRTPQVSTRPDPPSVPLPGFVKRAFLQRTQELIE